MDLDLHGLAGAYALDALPDDERRFFERHLAECADCPAEVAELRATAALLGAAAAEEPPSRLRERVLAGAAASDQERAPAAGDQERAPAVEPTVGWDRRERLRRLLPAVAAVVVLGVAGLVVVTTQTGPADAPPGEQLAALLAAPDAQVVTLAAPEGATARFVWSPGRGEGLFVTGGLEAAPHGHAYALWVIDAEAPALAGMFQPDEDGHVSHAIVDGLGGAVAVAVTVEPEAGVDAPTTDPLIVGEL